MSNDFVLGLIAGVITGLLLAWALRPGSGVRHWLVVVRQPRRRRPSGGGPRYRQTFYPMDAQDLEQVGGLDSQRRRRRGGGRR